MSLANTLVLKQVAAAEREQKLHSLVYDNQYVVFVVLGDDDKAQWLADKADLFAASSPQGVKRKVAWVHDRVELRDKCLEMLATSPNFKPEDYDRIAGFTLHPQQHTTRYLLYTDSIIQPLHIGLAYWMASKMD